MAIIHPPAVLQTVEACRLQGLYRHKQPFLSSSCQSDLHLHSHTCPSANQEISRWDKMRGDYFCVWCSWVGKVPWRRKWQPTPVFLPGESHGRRRLAGYNPWGCKESDTTDLIWIYVKGVKKYSGEKTIASKNGAGKTGQLRVKEWN